MDDSKVVGNIKSKINDTMRVNKKAPCMQCHVAKVLQIFLRVYLISHIYCEENRAMAQFLKSIHGCPNFCSGHGTCNDQNVRCKCSTGFTGADCSLRTCPMEIAWADDASETDQAHALAECSRLVCVCARACVCLHVFFINLHPF